MASSVLRQLADKIAPQLGGIDWAALETALSMSREQIVYHSDATKDSSQVGLFMYQVPMQAAFDKAELAMKDVVLSWSVTDDPNTSQDEQFQAIAAWKAVQRDIGDIGGAAISAMDSNFTFLQSDEALLMEREHFRAVVSATYLSCLYGLVTHAKKLMQYNFMPADRIVESADNITRGFNALAMLAERGALDPLKANAPSAVVQSPTSGLGLAPVAWAAIVSVVVVAIVAIIAWCVVAMERQTAVNKLIKDICDDAIKSGDPSKYNNCIGLAKINAEAATAPPNPGDWLSSAGKAALMIGFAFVLVWATPTVVRVVSMKLDKGTA